MKQTASKSPTTKADKYIRMVFLNFLQTYEKICYKGCGGPLCGQACQNEKCQAGDLNKPCQRSHCGKHASLSLQNALDGSTPPLKFKWKSGYVFRDILPPDMDTQTGCTSCKPDMGQNVGCEYTRICECLEYAEVIENRLTEGQKKRFREHDFTDLPKCFPYSKSSRLLVKTYLEARHPIYECNEKCACGPRCKTRVVQHGRQVPLEIFKTVDRGWGLCCKRDLKRGEFVDCYSGEVITNEEADRREHMANKGKESYLFSLDKFADLLTDEQREHMRVVDGEFMGGPVRFINHSCEPNCRQYVVSFNKNDHFLYSLAIFAVEDIPAGTELVYDYIDLDEQDEDDSQTELQVVSDSIPCLCGSGKCRRWLWI
jgi:[histone H3]-lysine9 N-trimethyltransferase SUV39H